MMKLTTLGAIALLGAGLSTVACTERHRERTEAQAERTADTAGQKMGDAATTTAVKSKLAGDVRLSTLTSINVDSSGNVVTLSGTVPTAADKAKAEDVAKTVDGVTRVINNLEVKP